MRDPDHHNDDNHDDDDDDDARANPDTHADALARDTHDGVAGGLHWYYPMGIVLANDPRQGMVPGRAFRQASLQGDPSLFTQALCRA